MAYTNVYLKVAWVTVMLSAPVHTMAASRGESVYQGTCVACHGEDGEGTMPGVPDLSSTNGPLSKSDAELMNNIIYGFRRPGSHMSMPPKGGNPRLDREDIEAVISYMRENFRKR